MTVTPGGPELGELEPAKPRRRVGYVHGKWRVAYVSPGESGGEAGVRYGLIVGPLVADVSTAIWVPVVPDGGDRHTMIHRDSITDIAPPRNGR